MGFIKDFEYFAKRFFLRSSARSTARVIVKTCNTFNIQTNIYLFEEFLISSTFKHTGVCLNVQRISKHFLRL